MSDPGAGDEYGLVGRTLQDRYRVDSELGRGGMATIYLAQDLRLGRWVVLKVPRLGQLSDPGLGRRFVAEVNDLARYEHPHIVGILDQGEYQEVPFAVLQYLSGGDLAARLRDDGGTADATDILDWLAPVARALDFIHSKGCLHRDVKPGNILFDEQGHPFLSDFGIATALDVIDAEAPTIPAQDQLTSAGMFVGSPAFAPPEAIDRIFTPAYDQYSLATVVYVCLAGALPFSGKTNEALLIAKTQEEPAPLPTAETRRPLPSGCEKVIRRALSRDPDDRFPSCTAFAEAFAEAARQSAGLRPARPVLAAVTLIALGAAAIAAWPAVSNWLVERAATSMTPEERPGEAAPATVRLGSTEDEVRAALALCDAHGGHCDPTEFAGETVRAVAPTGVVVDALEVTNARFAEFVADTGLVTLAESNGYSWDGPTRRHGASWRRPGGDIEALRRLDLPVVHVSRDEASRYCAWRGGRLPTADEWELAARGPERRAFPWGDAWEPERLRAIGAGGYGLEPVGSHPSGATPDGVQDLAGSVWEWTASDDAEGAIIKGGSWDTPNPAYFRSAAFASVAADTTSSDIGFRCARDP